VIIGYGITGIGVAYTLLNHADGKNLQATMLEARTAVGGATGWNGGHLVSDSDSLFLSLVKEVGLEQAAETVRFSEANIRRLRELVALLSPADREAVEFRDVTTSTAYEERDSFEEAVNGVRQLVKALPGGDLKYKVSSKDEASKVREGTEYCPWVLTPSQKFGYKNSDGALEQQGVAALWPYRLLTTVLASLRRNFGDWFTLETHTAVTTISHNGQVS
jgi:glycine/D-amino acid oxidase-like deaminating enzyme